MSQFDYLKDRINPENGCWLGKEFCWIPDRNKNFLETPIKAFEWYNNLPGVKFMRDHLMEFAGIKEILEEIETDITDIGFLTAEAIYGVNKAFNSSIHTEKLLSQGEAIAKRLKIGSQEQSLYLRAIDTYNETLNLPLLSLKLLELEELVMAMEKMVENVENLVKAAVDRAIASLYAAKAKAESLISSAEEAIVSRAKRLLSKINKILSSLAPKEILRPKFVPAAGALVPVIGGVLAPVAAGSLATLGATAIVGMVGSIATFLLGSFIMKATTEIPAIALGAIIQTTTSVVLKYFSSTGAEAARYYAAALLKESIKILPNLLPKVITSTGTEGTAWAFLTALAPQIAMAATIIIKAIKVNEEKEKELAEHFYVIADGVKPAIGYASIANANTTEKELLQIKKDLLALGEGSYTEIIGIGLNNKIEVAQGFNLTTPVLQKLSRSESKVKFEALRNKHRFTLPTGVWKPI